MNLEELKQTTLSNSTARHFFYYRDMPKSTIFERGKVGFLLSSASDVTCGMVIVGFLLMLCCWHNYGFNTPQGWGTMAFFVFGVLFYKYKQTALVIDYENALIYVRKTYFRMFEKRMNTININDIRAVGLSYLKREVAKKGYKYENDLCNSPKDFVIREYASIAFSFMDNSVIFWDYYTYSESLYKYYQWLAPRIAIALKKEYYDNPGTRTIIGGSLGSDYFVTLAKESDLSCVRKEFNYLSDIRNRKLYVGTCSGTIFLIIVIIIAGIYLFNWLSKT